MNFTPVRTINAHKGIIYHIIYLKDGRLASCSSDKTIKVFNLRDYNCAITLPAHDSEIWYIAQLPDLKIVSCSDDSSIKVWMISRYSYRLVHSILNAHEGYITQILPISGNRMVSCAYDETIKIWNSLPPYNLVKLLKDASDENESRQNTLYELKQKNMLLSCSVFGKGLTFYNLKTYCVETIISVCCCDRNAILEYDNKLFLGSYSSLSIINLDNLSVMELMDSEPDFSYSLCKAKLGDVICFLPIKKNVVMCCAGMGNVFLFDYKEKKRVKTKRKLTEEAIYRILKIDNDRFITCSNKIQFWMGKENL